MKSLVKQVVLVAVSSVTFATGFAQSLSIGLRLEPPHLDPTAGAAAAIDDVTYQNIFEGLTKIQANGEVSPALAKSWDISEDGLIYTFYLQQGVTFHDGTPFSAEDVVFSLNRARGQDSVNAQKALFQAIESVEAQDEFTVVISLSKPSGSLLDSLGWGDAVMVSESSAKKNKKTPIGTGAYLLERWVSGDSIKLKANPNYWGEQPEIQQVTFRFISDPLAATNALMSGDLDGFPLFPATENVEVFRGDSRFQVLEGTTEGETILAMNNKSDALSDLRVRRAISHAINRQDIIDGAMFGFGTPISTHFAPHHPAYIDLSSVYPFNPEKAKQLLKKAGYDKLKLRLVLPPPAYARRGGEIIASQLRDIGIETEIIPVEWAKWLAQAFKAKDYDLTIVSHVEPMDIGIYARPDYYFQYQDADFQKLIEALNQESNVAKRYRLLEQAQSQIVLDAVNVYLFQLAKVGIWSKKVQGMWQNSPQPAVVVSELSLR